MPAPLVHLLDGHVYIFRAYFAMPSMETPGGAPVEAAYGFTNTLLKYLAAEKPSHLAVCFDHAMTSFRNEIFPAYKSSREDPDEALEQQFEWCREACDALGVRQYAVPDYEADDALATVVEQVLAEGGRARVVTSDKDLAQLVTEDGRVELYDLGKDQHYDAHGVRDKFGVDPEQIPDYLALVGDTIDDLPGIPGVGPKGAAASLGVFRHLEDFPESPNEWEAVPVRGARRLAERFAQHREQALQVRELATVVREIPGLAPTLADLAFEGADPEQVDPLFDRLGWGRIRTRIPQWR